MKKARAEVCALALTSHIWTVLSAHLQRDLSALAEAALHTRNAKTVHNVLCESEGNHLRDLQSCAEQGAAWLDP